MEDLKYILAENLAKYRKAANLTQAELAEKINYSDKAVSKWERAGGMPDVDVLKQIADLYGVSLDDLVREHDEKEVMPKSTKSRQRLLTVLLSAGLCWLVAVVVFVAIGIFAPAFEYAWLAFVYAVPASSVVVLVFSCIWHYKWVRIVSVSVLRYGAYIPCNVNAAPRRFLYGRFPGDPAGRLDIFPDFSQQFLPG